MYFWISGTLALFGCVAWIKQWQKFPAIAWYFYALASLILGLIEHSTPFFLYGIRYFFLVISGFITLLMPFILMGIGSVGLFKTLQQSRTKPIEVILNVSLFLIFTSFVLFTLWGLTQKATMNFARFISIYSLLATYFFATVLSFLMLMGVLYWWPKPKEVNQLIILGTEIDEEGQVLDTLRRRLNKGLAYYNQSSKDLHFVLTGGAVLDQPVSEASQMKNYLIDQGIDQKKIWLEPHAKNTQENFYFTWQLLSRMKQTVKPLVITSAFHVVRSKYIAQSQGIKTSFLTSSVSWYLWPYLVAREYLAFILLTKLFNYIFILGVFCIGIYQVLFLVP
ncbi:YdcF family protein [Dolosicoccus paucivorans]|uniref:YdcF family protein n=1 Tax=Dolosicoccus paucivorans TaxID=84521 RepID=UPI000883F7E3|nr:YdcF family protein [Dolosicoccus paucivorans]SDI47337.1 Uncharacterized SAM-binding protein YcdF, DUF218 family [Dolosicoccus paucivorans]